MILFPEAIQAGGEQARVGLWRGEPEIAYLVPAPGAPALSARFVSDCLEVLRRRGFSQAITGPLAPDEQLGFLNEGFEVREHLALLVRQMADLPATRPYPPELALRRARRKDRPSVLAVDRLAFAQFWRIDEAGLEEALTATPAHRFRLAFLPQAGPGRTAGVVGYLVSGRSGLRGYVQRLVIHPEYQRVGLGWRLMLDSIRWMKRRGVKEAVVNTQPENQAALALYRNLGFRLQPEGLDVLSRRLDR